MAQVLQVKVDGTSIHFNGNGQLSTVGTPAGGELVQWFAFEAIPANTNLYNLAVSCKFRKTPSSPWYLLCDMIVSSEGNTSINLSDLFNAGLGYVLEGTAGMTNPEPFISNIIEGAVPGLGEMTRQGADINLRDKQYSFANVYQDIHTDNYFLQISVKNFGDTDPHWILMNITQLL